MTDEQLYNYRKELLQQWYRIGVPKIKELYYYGMIDKGYDLLSLVRDLYYENRISPEIFKEVNYNLIRIWFLCFLKRSERYFYWRTINVT